MRNVDECIIKKIDLGEGLRKHIKKEISIDQLDYCSEFGLTCVLETWYLVNRGNVKNGAWLTKRHRRATTVEEDIIFFAEQAGLA